MSTQSAATLATLAASALPSSMRTLPGSMPATKKRKSSEGPREGLAARNRAKEAVAVRDVSPVTTNGKTYPAWIDDKSVQNATLAKETARRGWKQTAGRYPFPLSMDDKRQWLREYCHEKKDFRPALAPTSKELAEQAERVDKAAERRKVIVETRKVILQSTEVSNDSDDSVPADTITAELNVENENLRKQCATLNVENENLRKQCAEFEAETKESRRIAYETAGHADELKQRFETEDQLTKQAIRRALEPGAYEAFKARFDELVEAEETATSPWDKALVHAKRARTCTKSACEASQTLKDKITAAIQANPTKTPEQHVAADAASMRHCFLMATLKPATNIVSAVEYACSTSA